MPAETLKSAVPGEQFPVRVHLDNPGESSLQINRVWLETPAGESWSAHLKPLRLRPLRRTVRSISV